MQTFVKKGITCITKARKISKFFTRTTAQQVTNRLWASSTDTPKYEPDLQFQDSKTNESNDESDGDIEEEHASETEQEVQNVD
jgi:hypothetical protein